MRPLFKGLLLTTLHTAMVLSLGGKLLIDRTLLPRVWVQTLPYDPSLPIRGRYARLRIVVDAPGLTDRDSTPRSLHVQEGRLVAAEQPPGRHYAQGARVRDAQVAVLREPVAYFIAEHTQDPSIRLPGETLWVEVSVPKSGPPRPIRLGVKRGDGEIEPLALE